MIAKDGSEVWIHDQSRLVSTTTTGTPSTGRACCVDVTEQRRTQELERDARTRADEAERLRAEDEMKTTFLQAVSHDLRTPLAAILGLAVTLEREDLDIDRRRDTATWPTGSRRTPGSSTASSATSSTSSG